MDFAPPTDFPAPARNERGPLPVFIGGAASTAVAIAVHLFGLQHRFNAFGWHINWVIPGGALLLGLLASIGFAVAAYKGGHRITRGVLLVSALILLGGYVGGQYVQYRQDFPDGRFDDGTSIGFLDYYDKVARNIQFRDKRGHLGSKLGAWGLGARGLQILGFVLGGLLPAFVLMAKPYCQACGRYRTSKQVGLVPADLTAKWVGDKSPERVAERARLRESAEATMRDVFAAAAKGDGPAIADRLEREGPKAKRSEIDKVDSRFVFELEHCPGCGDGTLIAKLRTLHGKHVKHAELQRAAVTRTVTDALKA
jgi:hypothetical protein